MDEAYDDLNEESFYCEHGKYIGSPYGPDYLCQWCEDGVSAAEYAAIMRERAIRDLREAEAGHERLIRAVQHQQPGKRYRVMLALIDYQLEYVIPKFSKKAVAEFLAS